MFDCETISYSDSYSTPPRPPPVDEISILNWSPLPEVTVTLVPPLIAINCPNCSDEDRISIGNLSAINKESIVDDCINPKSVICCELDTVPCGVVSPLLADIAKILVSKDAESS